MHAHRCLRVGSCPLPRCPAAFADRLGKQDRIQGYRAGVDAYLPKPFDPEELFSIMDNILVRRVDLAQEILGLRQDIRQLKDVMEQVR